MQQHVYDIAIIGAGAAGLVTAYELIGTAQKICIIEAKEKTGGRIHSLYDERFDLPVELGAEFVHGKGEITNAFIKKAGLQLNKVNGSIWQKIKGRLQEQEDFIEDQEILNKKLKAVDQDITIQQFFEQHLNEPHLHDLRISLKNYVEGYYAADISNASTLALREEMERSEIEQMRIDGGYKKLLHYLENELKENGCHLYFSSPVHTIDWQENVVKIDTPHHHFIAAKTVITIPVGVLKTGGIKFIPALTQKDKAIQQLGFGSVAKILMQFSEAFWLDKKYTRNKDLHDLSFLFSDEEIPTWWTHYPKQSSLLTGWLGGPHANKIAGYKPIEVIGKSIESLSQIFNIDNAILKKSLLAYHFYNWPLDPFISGGYSYHVVNGKQQQEKIKEPVQETLFFAGEGLCDGPEIGTVEGAMKTARDAALQVKQSLQKMV